MLAEDAAKPEYARICTKRVLESVPSESGNVQLERFYTDVWYPEGEMRNKEEVMARQEPDRLLAEYQSAVRQAQTEFETANNCTSECNCPES